ncbi:MAG: hypothetical protein ABIO55_08100 [Ginsengibacter sp.]
MNKKISDVDIVNDVLEECILAYPVSSFIISIYKQYMQRGSLSKKQLQGLYGKASQIKDISIGKLATLEAVIKRMPTRYKSDLPEAKPLYQKDEGIGQIIEAILSRYPQHKRVLYLQSKYENNELLSQVEISEIKKFNRILK